MWEPAGEEFGLLPGEEQVSLPQADAEHWMKVYQELIEFCELMLRRPEQSLEAAHLRRRLSYYRRWLQHWRHLYRADHRSA
jgi:hypothetical protein